MQRDLLRAIDRDQPDEVARLLGQGASADRPCEDGRAPVTQGDPRLARCDTPLLRAARCGNGRVVRVLLQHGASIAAAKKAGLGGGWLVSANKSLAYDLVRPADAAAWLDELGDLLELQHDEAYRSFSLALHTQAATQAVLQRVRDGGGEPMGEPRARPADADGPPEQPAAPAPAQYGRPERLSSSHWSGASPTSSFCSVSSEGAPLSAPPAKGGPPSDGEPRADEAEWDEGAGGDEGPDDLARYEAARFSDALTPSPTRGWFADHLYRPPDRVPPTGVRLPRREAELVD